jgi:hypothetical protein
MKKKPLNLSGVYNVSVLTQKANLCMKGSVRAGGHPPPPQEKKFEFAFL